eukprot:2544672-Rhodomonas_salina.1
MRSSTFSRGSPASFAANWFRYKSVLAAGLLRGQAVGSEGDSTQYREQRDATPGAEQAEEGGGREAVACDVREFERYRVLWGRIAGVWSSRSAMRGTARAHTYTHAEDRPSGNSVRARASQYSSPRAGVAQYRRCAASQRQHVLWHGRIKDDCPAPP